MGKNTYFAQEREKASDRSLGSEGWPSYSLAAASTAGVEHGRTFTQTTHAEWETSHLCFLSQPSVAVRRLDPHRHLWRHLQMRGTSPLLRAAFLTAVASVSLLLAN